MTRQPEQVKAFRDTWELGIHSYLAYLRDRLTVARDLLTETGSVFVQISDENLHLVRCLLDEVFGSEHFCLMITYQKTGGIPGKLIAPTMDYIIWYAKNKDIVKFRPLFLQRETGDTSLDRYDQVETDNGIERRINSEEFVNPNSIQGKRFQLTSLFSEGTSPRGEPSFEFQGKIYVPSSGKHWTTRLEGLERLAKADRIRIMGTVLRYKRYLDDLSVKMITDRWDSIQLGAPRVYVVQTSLLAIQRCLLMTTDPGDLVLDPTCGSGTTAYVAEQWGRRWITVDTSRVALALARTRLMSARYPYYLLADSPAGLKKEAELRQKELTKDLTGFGNLSGLPPTEGDLRKGFVYRRVPHIMLKDIANNQEIDAIHAKWQAQLEPILKDLAGLGNLPGLNPGWQTWDLPRDPGPDWPPAAQKLLAQYWQFRRQRQAEIEASISRQAEQEILYDQPFEDKSTVRVTGPFSVESLSPHRVLSPAQPLPDSERQAKTEADAGQFESMILDNLRKAGVQNTKKGERLKFDRLELSAGEYLQAEGDYTETPTPPSPPSTGGLGGGKKRVAVAIGPEFGTVGKQLLQAAAREAVRGLGYDLLLVCGFAFDPDVSEEAKQMGRLTVLPVRMNPDLSMGDTLLKKTGSGNLFMIFGEPDVTVSRTPASQVVVELKGLDIYDPTTGQIRNSSLDDIARWFIDTAYNGQSFFVRHAYFTRAGEPYDQLKRALRADINEDAWAALYRPISLPFDPPTTGQIAVKVINHYGDEALKVFEVK